MKISSENLRICVSDNPELALTKGQQQLFAHWEMGFDAQGRGEQLKDCPEFHSRAGKIRKVWREGWQAGAAVDRLKTGWLVPTHNPTQTNAIILNS